MAPHASLAELQAEMEVDLERLSRGLEGFIRDQMIAHGRVGVAIPLSGGIDSSVVVTLCQRAVGPEKTLALLMPDRVSAKRHRQDAIELAEELHVRWKLVDLTPTLACLGVYRIPTLNNLPRWFPFRNALVRWLTRRYEAKSGRSIHTACLAGDAADPAGAAIARGLAYGRIKHRLRLAIIYLWAERERRLVAGAANKSEASTGFYVKHGVDGAADIMPIVGLYKTQVKALARHLGVPSQIVEKAPTPDMGFRIDDEAMIGMPYEQLDLILLALEKGWGLDEVASCLGIGQDRVRYVKDLTDRTEKMRQVYSPDLAAIMGDPPARP